MKYALSVFIFLIAACGNEDTKKATGKSVVQFTAPTSLKLAGGDPGAFAIKLKYVQILEDMDANGGSLGDDVIWLNTKCSDTAGCDSTDTEYFDMIDPTVVNQALNSQDHPLTIWEGEGDPPADASKTYKYVRLSFCTSDKTSVKWSDSNVTDVVGEPNFCLVDSVAMDPPLVLTEGKNAVINVAYSLSGRVRVDGEETGSDEKFGRVCAPVVGEETRYCLAFPSITATVSGG